MRKSLIRFVAFVLAMLSAFALAACGASDNGREVGEVMFREKEDKITETDEGDETVTPDVNIRIYNYAPSVFQEDENTRHVYYCANRPTSPTDSNRDIDGDDQITDWIAYRKGTKKNGVWTWSDKQYLFGPIIGSETEGEHVCDPNVIKGEFKWKGTTYPYLMAYLACGERNLLFNHISLAVAEKPEGPWIRCEEINPIIKYSDDGVPDNVSGKYLWGFGQASMISVDKMGRVLMFYSSIRPYYEGVDENSKELWNQRTCTAVQRFDFSDLGDIKAEFEIDRMGIDGIKRFDRQADVISNGDYAYDESSGRIYGITDASYDYRRGTSGAPLYYTENGSGEIGDSFKTRAEGGANPIWTTIHMFKPTDLYNYITVHNTAIIRDPYGWLFDPNNIEVALTGACVDGNFMKVHPEAVDPPVSKPRSLWSYRILRQTFTLK